jgi:hypothetical protein
VRPGILCEFICSGEVRINVWRCDEEIDVDRGKTRQHKLLDNMLLKSKYFADRTSIIVASEMGNLDWLTRYLNI